MLLNTNELMHRPLRARGVGYSLKVVRQPGHALGYGVEGLVVLGLGS